MTLVLWFAAAFGLGKVAAREVGAYERAAAAEISARLTGDSREVRVHAAWGLPALFGEVERVQIQAERFGTPELPFYTEPRRSRAGVLGRLDIDLSDFTLAGLPVRRLRASIPDCRFDLPLALRRRQFRLSRSGIGVGEVEVTQDALTEFVKRKYPDFRQVQVRIDRDKVIVEGRGRLMMISADFFVVSRLRVQDGTKLNLDGARMLLNGRPADPAATAALVKAINPVVDLDVDLKLAGALFVERLMLREGILRAEGKARIPERPKA